jgi:NAD(P)-dependent dehydrogenase (short-subunit alcohol dehydrogenase family)
MHTWQPNNPFDFRGHTALVTGGAGALGGEMAAALATQGADVIIVDVREPSEALWQRLRAGPGRVSYAYASVTDRQALAAVAEQAAEGLGTPDLLLNVAGLHAPQATTGEAQPLFELPEEAIRLVLDVNLVGTILACQVFGRAMAARGTGAIVNISSVSSFRSLTRVPAYSASKAAVNNFTRWLAVHMAQEYSPRIRVNAIAPGFILTDLNRSLLTQEDGALTERGRAVLAHVPMARFCAPDELVGTVLWLLSPASSYVTGVVVPVDGGFTAYSGV